MVCVKMPVCYRLSMPFDEIRDTALKVIDFQLFLIIQTTLGVIDGIVLRQQFIRLITIANNDLKGWF
jgi:hypothetical protein